MIPRFPDKLHASGAAGPMTALLAFVAYSSHDVVVKLLGATYSVFQNHPVLGSRTRLAPVTVPPAREPDEESPRTA